MWYVIQTLTGREEALVSMIHKMIPSAYYQDCFVAYYERVWRREQKSIVHVERLFPGYVFILTDKPESLFLQLGKIPAMSKMIADGEFTFLALEEGEETFFQSMLGEERIVRLSYVETDGKGHILSASEPLNHYMDHLVKVQLKKRYAVIKLHLLGKEKTVVLGIILKDDVLQEQ